MGDPNRAQARRLPDGRRLHLHDGPIDLIVEAVGAPGAVEAAYRAAAARFRFVLDELCAELPALRAPASAAPARFRESGRAVAWSRRSRPMPRTASSRRWRRLREASPTKSSRRCGRRAEEGLARLSRQQRRRYRSLARARREATTVGLVDRPDRPSLFARARIAAGDGIGGIATSGAPGRSFSLGDRRRRHDSRPNRGAKPTPPRPSSPTPSIFPAILASSGVRREAFSPTAISATGS